MKRSELKKVLKPIVKEMVEDAVEEILLEEGYINNKLQEMILRGGLIKGVVTQVASGLTEGFSTAPAQPIVESQARVTSGAPASAGELRRRMKQKMGITGNVGTDREALRENPMISKIKNNSKLGKMFEGTTPMDGDGSAVLSDGTPNYKDPLSVSATIPDPELGGPVDPDTLNALLGGKKFNFG